MYKIKLNFDAPLNTIQKPIGINFGSNYRFFVFFFVQNGIQIFQIFFSLPNMIFLGQNNHLKHQTTRKIFDNIKKWKHTSESNDVSLLMIIFRFCDSISLNISEVDCFSCPSSCEMRRLAIPAESAISEFFRDQSLR